MEFLDPHELSDEDFKESLRELAVDTIFSYDFMWQEVRRCEMENKVFVIVDQSHHIDVDRHTLVANPRQAIVDFITKWAPMPEGVTPLPQKEKT